MDPPQKYKYKMTILNNAKRSRKAIIRYLHHSSYRFYSMTDLRVCLLEELGDDLPDTIKFDVGYYEDRSSKCLLVTGEDLNQMYEKFKKKEEVLLWCDVDCSDGASSLDKSRKRKRETEKSEEDVDTIYKDLKDKHGDTYTVPQFGKNDPLWNS